MQGRSSGLVFAAPWSKITTNEVDMMGLLESRTYVVLNLANLVAAYRWWLFPADGIGLARIKFFVSNVIQVHSMALVHLN
jgi:pyruvate,water dikinase